MARPQGDWAAPVEADDGTGCGGGDRAHGRCLLARPEPLGGGPNYVDALAGFDGESIAGVWTVCVGDAVSLDTGTFDAVTLSFAASVAVEDDAAGEFAFGLVGANPFPVSTALGLRVTFTQHVAATLHDLLSRLVSQFHDGGVAAGSDSASPETVPPRAGRRRRYRPAARARR